MRGPYCIPVLCALSLLGSVALTVLTIRSVAAQAPRAKIVSVEGAETTYEVEGRHGQLVTVEMPSQSVADVKLSNPDQGTVEGKVIALDGQTDRVKVHTRAGQTLMLEMDPEFLRGLRLGDIFTLAVPRPTGR
jgi:hypothetical protein